MSTRLSILIYHRVLAHPDPLLPEVPDVHLFARQMTILQRYFRVLPLSDAVRRLASGTLPAHAACITFDDGYADNAEHALPVLQARGLPACVFVATGFLDGGRMWNDAIIEHVRQAAPGWLDGSALGLGVLPARNTAEKVCAIAQLLNHMKYLPPGQREALTAGLAPAHGQDLMLSTSRLRALHRAGIEIGAHTDRHPILSNVPDAVAHAEMAGSKQRLEQILAAPVTLFAYPNGKPGRDFSSRHAEMAASLGFQAAVTTASGVCGPGSDPYQLPRYTPWEPGRARFLFRMLQSHWRAQA